MFGLGMPELIVILVIIMIVFGAGKLPEIGAGIGKGIRNFKKAVSGELETAFFLLNCQFLTLQNVSYFCIVFFKSSSHILSDCPSGVVAPGFNSTAFSQAAMAPSTSCRSVNLTRPVLNRAIR